MAFWKELSIFPAETLWVLEHTVDYPQLLLETKAPRGPPSSGPPPVSRTPTRGHPQVTSWSAAGSVVRPMTPFAPPLGWTRTLPRTRAYGRTAPVGRHPAQPPREDPALGVTGTRGGHTAPGGPGSGQGRGRTPRTAIRRLRLAFPPHCPGPEADPGPQRLPASPSLLGAPRAGTYTSRTTHLALNVSPADLAASLPQ